MSIHLVAINFEISLSGFNRDRGNFRESDRGNRFDGNREERRGFGNRRFENDREVSSRDDRDSERVGCKFNNYNYVYFYFIFLLNF